MTRPDMIEAGEHSRLESPYIAEKRALQPELLLDFRPNGQTLDVEILRFESALSEAACDPAVDSTEVRCANQQRSAGPKRGQMGSHDSDRIIEMFDQAERVDHIEL